MWCVVVCDGQVRDRESGAAAAEVQGERVQVVRDVRVLSLCAPLSCSASVPSASAAHQVPLRAAAGLHRRLRNGAAVLRGARDSPAFSARATLATRATAFALRVSSTSTSSQLPTLSVVVNLPYKENMCFSCRLPVEIQELLLQMSRQLIHAQKNLLPSGQRRGPFSDREPEWLTNLEQVN